MADAVKRPHVVIVGAGFGGLEAAKALRRAAVDITVIDRQNHHLFQPLLYQVATAALSPADIAWPIRHMLARQGNVTVLMEEVRAIDRGARRLVTDAAEVDYDYLVLATGATHSYFGHDDWAGVAPGLKRIEDATLILIAFERAELAATGVELAGAIAEVARQTLPPDFRRIDPRTARILLIEAGPRILPALPEKLAAYAARALARMGVEVLTGNAVTACDEHGVAFGGKSIEVGTIIWAAGVVAAPAGAWLDAPTDRAGRVLVQADLSVPGASEIFVVGDCAALVFTPGRLVPGLAAAAKQMGRYTGTVIAARVAGAPAPAAFRYRHQGDLATIGRRAAVVNLRHITLTGFVGWLFWSAAHIYFLIGLRTRFVVAISWAWQYLTYQRGARLITRAGIDNRQR